MCMRLRTTSHSLKKEDRSQVTAQLCQALESIYLTHVPSYQQKEKTHNCHFMDRKKTFNEPPKGGPSGSN